MIHKRTQAVASGFAAVLAAIGWATAAAQTQGADGNAVFEAKRTQAVAAKDADRRATEARHRICADAELSEDELVRVSTRRAELLQNSAETGLGRKEREALQVELAKLDISIPVQATQIQSKRIACERAEKDAEAAKALRKTALKAFTTVAMDSRMTASPSQGSTGSTSGPGTASGSAAGTTPTAHELRSLVESAASAQEAAEMQRKNLAGIYDEVDKATQHALRLTDVADAKYLEDARLLQHLVDSSLKQRRAVQEAANDLVDKALRLKGCALSYDLACASALREVHRDARIAQDVHERALQRSKALAEQALDIALRINIAFDHDDPKSRKEAYEFAKVLADYPQASAPFAKDSFEILAGREGRASLQFGLNAVLPKGWSRVTAKVSSPLSEDKTDIFGSADGLANSRSFSLAWQAEGLRGRVLATTRWLWATSLELGWGYQTREFYEDGPAAFTKGTTSQTVQPWQLGAAFAFHEVGGRNAHLLTLKGQRTHELPPAEIRCPVDRAGDLAFVSCVNGSFGPPSAEKAAVLGYEYRYKGTDFALSPSIAYNTRSRVRTLGLPLYLVRSADDDKRPLNAGVRLEHNTKGKTSITGRSESNWSWGVFVGAPFKLFGLSD